MNTEIADLKPDPTDLVVIPMDMAIPETVPFLVHRVKFLHKPSIIKSGYSTMNMLETYTPAVFKKWFGFLGDTTSEKKTEEVIVAKGQVIKTDEPYLPCFFRYTRLVAPVKNSVNNNWALNAKGGLTIFVELNPRDNAFAFSYAICSTEDNFSKELGRTIAKTRFMDDDWYEISGYDPKLSVLENIKIALKDLLASENKGIITNQKQGIHFSSLSEKMKFLELKQIYERI